MNGISTDGRWAHVSLHLVSAHANWHFAAAHANWHLTQDTSESNPAGSNGLQHANWH